MSDILVTALFCEDIRREQSGQRTLVGVLNDTLAVPKFPGSFPRLGVFIRVAVPIARQIRVLEHRLLSPDGTKIAEILVPQELVNEIHTDAKSKGNPKYGFISEFQMTMLGIEKAGIFEVISKFDDEEVQSGFLNIVGVPEEG